MNKKTSYKVGSMLAVAAIVLSPIAASAATSSTSVQATVAPVISVSSTPTVAMSVTPAAGGVESAPASDTVTVNSNDADGYTLTLSNDATLTMAGFKDDGVTSNGATLIETTGTLAAPAALALNSWGYRVDNLGTFGAPGATTYAKVITGPGDTIKSTTATATSEVTTVKYAVKVDLSKPNGIYKDTVTYTALVK